MAIKGKPVAPAPAIYTGPPPSAASVKDVAGGGRDRPLVDAHGFASSPVDYADEYAEPRPVPITPQERQALHEALKENGFSGKPWVSPWWGLKPAPRLGDGIIPAVSLGADGVAVAPWSADRSGYADGIRFSAFFPSCKLTVDIFELGPGRTWPAAEVARRTNRCHEEGIAYLPVLRQPGLGGLLVDRVRDALARRDAKVTEVVPPEVKPPLEPDPMADAGIGGVREHGEQPDGGPAASVRPRRD